MPRVLYHGKLEAKTYSEKGHFLLSRPLGSDDHALCPSGAEASRYKNASAGEWAAHQISFLINEI